MRPGACLRQRGAHVQRAGRQQAAALRGALQTKRESEAIEDRDPRVDGEPGREVAPRGRVEQRQRLFEVDARLGELTQVHLRNGHEAQDAQAGFAAAVRRDGSERLGRQPQ